VAQEERGPVVLPHGLAPGGVREGLEVVLARRPRVKSRSIEAGSPDSFRKPWTPPMGTWKKSPGPASTHVRPSWSRTAPLSTKKDSVMLRWKCGDGPEGWGPMSHRYSPNAPPVVFPVAR
jgi:hypothetical protein